MNKGIEVTINNFNDIASRLIKFFNHDSFVSWHGFDCGMRKRVRRVSRTSLGDRIDTTVEYRRPYVIKDTSDGDSLSLNIIVRPGVISLEVGDTVWFLGNRIVLKNSFSFCTRHCTYICFQIGDLKDFSR